LDVGVGVVVEGLWDSVILVDGWSGPGKGQRRLAPVRSSWRRGEQKDDEWSRGSGGGKGGTSARRAPFRAVRGGG
jgi:hypothetical protein